MEKETIMIDGVRYCVLKKENCYYLAEAPKRKSPCEGCCYGPCVSFCMKKILGYKGEEVPASVR